MTDCIKKERKGKRKKEQNVHFAANFAVYLSLTNYEMCT